MCFSWISGFCGGRTLLLHEWRGKARQGEFLSMTHFCSRETQSALHFSQPETQKQTLKNKQEREFEKVQNKSKNDNILKIFKILKKNLKRQFKKKQTLRSPVNLFHVLNKKWEILWLKLLLWAQKKNNQQTKYCERMCEFIALFCVDWRSLLDKCYKYSFSTTAVISFVKPEVPSVFITIQRRDAPQNIAFCALKLLLTHWLRDIETVPLKCWTYLNIMNAFWNSYYNYLNLFVKIRKMYSLLSGCWTAVLQVQSELRRWLRKCHNQSHLTPAKRSITQITIRTREGLAGPPSIGNISSVWFFKNCPRGWSRQVEHQWPLSKPQTPYGLFSTAHLSEDPSEHCWELHERHQQLELRPQTLFI